MAETTTTDPTPADAEAIARKAKVVADAKALLATLPADHPRRALAEQAVRQIENSDPRNDFVLAG